MSLQSLRKIAMIKAGVEQVQRPIYAKKKRNERV